jgi:hypothetical protein
VDNILLKNAWLEAKSAYVRDRGAHSRDALLTYMRQRERRDDWRAYLKLNKGQRSGGKINFPEGKDYEWVDEEDVQFSNPISELNYLFDQSTMVKKVYMEELQLVIFFQLMLISQATELQAFERQYLFKFIKEKRAELFALGIQIQIPDEGSQAVRYSRVITEIQKLKADQQTMFNNLREHSVEEQRKIEEEHTQLAQ